LAGQRIGAVEGEHLYAREIQQYFEQQVNEIREAGLYKAERLLSSPQGGRVRVTGGRQVLNLCANNYLGLANHPEIVKAAREALDRWGYGLSSVRFICGTQELHRDLEKKISAFLGAEETILYGSCFDANGGLFETLLGPEDAVISDELNHASIIDGIRLCRARRFRYRNSDMEDLEVKLKEASSARHKLIATDGVFSMDGYLANLPGIRSLADQYGALLMVDDSHAVGFVGPGGRGTHEHHNVMDGVDLITGTLGKALGGASGGYTSGRKELIALLRQRSRPYLFSNSVAPAIVAASLRAIELLSESDEARTRLRENTAFFRQGLEDLGFQVLPGEHPIVPVMLGDAALATRFSDLLLGKGVYVIGFSYPVVPKGKARIRTQVSAAHSREDLTFALEQFRTVKRELDL
jgi:glycine C-acetyltransferase